MAPSIESLPDIICRSHYREQQKPHRWVLEQDVTIKLSTDIEITIPQGFVTDFASVPRLLWGVIIPVGRHNLAVLIHDWLYDNKHISRSFADKEMLYWLKKTGCSSLKSYAMYLAVRLGGRSWWER